MVFTVAQTTPFFKGNNQMGLSNRTRVYLQGKVIALALDLDELLSNDAWSQIIENCKRQPQVAGQAGELVNQAPFQLPAKSPLRLRLWPRLWTIATRLQGH